jgi:glucose/arabinose dehydrogenase
MIAQLIKLIISVLITFVVLVGIGNVFADYLRINTENARISQLKLPTGFKLSVFAGHLKGQDLTGVRMMTIGPDGHLYATLTKQNQVVMLPDDNRDGVADKVVMVADKGLNAPHGLVFANGQLYVANQDSVVRLEQQNGQWPAAGVTPIIKDLATGWHTLKSLKLGPDGHLYLNVGSSCNVCVEGDATRATMMRYTLAGQPAGHLVTLGRHVSSALWAKGLRNTQGFAWHPVTGDMYATNEGADNRSDIKNGKVNDDLPPEHLNKIEAGQHYGWPYCWGNQFADPNFAGEAGFCKTTQAPQISFVSHSTPIGISFLNMAAVPDDYKKDAIVALHGSWNRKQPSGYALVRVKFNDQYRPISIEDFATGWLQGKRAWGRPVDVIVGTDGAIYVSDDEMGVIYRITYQH